MCLLSTELYCLGGGEEGESGYKLNNIAELQVSGLQ